MILLLAACGELASTPAQGDVIAPAPLPSPPPLPPTPPRVVGLALGEQTTCLAHDDDVVVCRGALAEPPMELAGLLEVDDTRLCGRFEGRVRCSRGGLVQDRPTPFVELARGGGVPCGRDAEGQVFCLSGRDRDESDANLRPVTLPAGAVRVVADGERVRALLADGRMFAWDPFDAMVRDPSPTAVEHEVQGIDATWMQTCWWTASTVRCTGQRERRLPGVTSVAVGRAHACALAAGEVTCWGDDAYGQTAVPDLGEVVLLDAGDDHTCALDRDHRVRCWGRDDRGQLRTE